MTPNVQKNYFFSKNLFLIVETVIHIQGMSTVTPNALHDPECLENDFFTKKLFLISETISTASNVHDHPECPAGPRKPKKIFLIGDIFTNIQGMSTVTLKTLDDPKCPRNYFFTKKIVDDSRDVENC
jgi:hypothetical protein